MGIFARITDRLDRRSQLMAAMMKELDVDIGAAGMQACGASLTNAARACVACQSAGECQQWLADCEANGRSSDPTFCPNQSFFAFYRR